MSASVIDFFPNRSSRLFWTWDDGSEDGGQKGGDNLAMRNKVDVGWRSLVPAHWALSERGAFVVTGQKDECVPHAATSICWAASIAKSLPATKVHLLIKLSTESQQGLDEQYLNASLDRGNLLNVNLLTHTHRNAGKRLI